jgi:uncharacterized protein YebE (UPF0316 family)
LVLDISAAAVLMALVIFALRIINNAIFTLRLVVITQKRRLLAATLAFIESLIFAYVIANVVTDLSNILNLLAYCAGFAAGNYAGMVLESRLITSYMTVNIISSSNGHEIAEALRAAGFGVTETTGIGRDGQVLMLRSVVTHRDVPQVVQLVRHANEQAFISVEEARSVTHGWIRHARGLRH